MIKKMPLPMLKCWKGWSMSKNKIQCSVINFVNNVFCCVGVYLNATHNLKTEL